MPSTRKPQPKSQKEISNSLVDPYVSPETGQTLGNPNTQTEFNQFSANDQNGIDINRSEQMSFKDDTTKPFTLGLQDIDESIMYYFQNVIKPTVIQNGVRIAVPVIYGSPERWKSTQKDGYYKDKNGAIMSPLIMFKRDTIDKNRSLTNKIDANTPHLYTSFKKVYNLKNDYSNFNILNNRIPTEQFIVNVVPDYVTLTYSCTIQTYYMEQLNKIIEAINYASDSYWGDPERFKFKASIDSYATTVEITDNTNRIVKGTFSIKLFGYVVPDTIQKELTAIKKYNSKSQVIIGIETTNSIIAGNESFSPVNTVVPAITGTNNIGQVLTTTDGTWTGTPAPTFAYQWFRGAAAISGQTATTYTIQSQDLHPTAQAITCQVTATNASGTAVATSNIITPVILPFVFTIDTNNISAGSSTSTQFKLPLTSSAGLNIVVDWGDATTSTITSHTAAAVTHSYAIAGTYTISITGTLQSFAFANAGDKLKILEVQSWGVLHIAPNTSNQVFHTCTNLTCIATDAPKITNTNFSFMFFNCVNFNGAIGNWDVSGVGNFTFAFCNTTAFNQPLNNWDTSNALIMSNMFRSTTATPTGFNQDIGSWDVSNVTDFSDFMTGKTAASFSAANLDAIYNGWSASGVKPNLTITFGSARYTAAGQPGKDILDFAPNNWTITDGGI
jgi:hypothetical protein